MSVVLGQSLAAQKRILAKSQRSGAVLVRHVQTMHLHKTTKGNQPGRRPPHPLRIGNEQRRLLSCTASIRAAGAGIFTGMSDHGLTESQQDVRRAISAVCSRFDDNYWLTAEREKRYPHELYDALRDGGWLGICMDPEYGGAGLGVSEATIMLQTIAESGASVAGAQSIHANVYPIMPLLKFATAAQKTDWLPRIQSGAIRSCFAVTEPTTGSETLALKTTATKRGDKYIIDGQKIWTSSAQVASHVVLLARTSAPSPSSRSSGLSLFFAPLRVAGPNTPHVSSEDSSLRPGVTMSRIDKMGGNAVDANEIFFSGFEVDASCLVGPEGEGFKVVLHGMNAERCLLAGEALGTGYVALKKAVDYANERVVFGKPIGAMQGVQHPLAAAWAGLEGARHLTYAAARLYDEGHADVGGLANAAKMVAAEAGFKACETAVLAMGGMGYAKEYHVERYMREVMVPRLAPVSREMVLNYLGVRVLGLPRSY